jgi:hypothetical protein
MPLGSGSAALGLAANPVRQGVWDDLVEADR